MTGTQPPAGVSPGKYEVLGRGAAGGMGEVYQVRHRLLGEVRALKVMRDAAAPDLELQRRFLQEARIASRLRHPNLAQLYDLAFHEDGTAYMVLEWVDGSDLSKLLGDFGPLVLEDALEIAAQSLEVLDYLHREGIVHRDVATDNLMVTRGPNDELRVKLIDLGIAKSMRSEHGLTRKGLFVGKLRYAAPETIDSDRRTEKPDPRSDLYSFGVVLYEMVTGVSPIEGTSESEVLASHLLAPPTPFSKTDPEHRVPEKLRRLILRALEKDPENRFESAGEFAAALAELRKDLARARPDHLKTTLAPARPELAVTGLAAEQKRLDRTFATESSGWSTLPSGAPKASADPSAVREEWFGKLREAHARRGNGGSRLTTTIVGVIKSHPKPIAAGTSIILLAIVISLSSFLSGGDTAGGETVAEISGGLTAVETDAAPEPPPAGEPVGEETFSPLEVETAAAGEASGQEETTDTPPPRRASALVLISDSPVLTEEFRREAAGFDLVVRSNLEQALAAGSRAGGGLLVRLEARERAATVEAYETEIPVCVVEASGQILELPRMALLFTRTIEERGPRCGDAKRLSGRRLVEALAPEVRRLARRR